MARKLKVFQTAIGFFELAVAAPSMKAAADAWGSDPDIFQRGFARQADDPKVVEAAMAAPGVVLRRPVGSQDEFSEHAALPKVPESKPKASRHPSQRAASRESAGTKEADDKAKQAAREQERKALEGEKRQEAERERKEAERRRAREEAERERARKQREQMIAKANAAFEIAHTRHDSALESLRQRREELDSDEAREKERWEKEQRRHEHTLKELEP